MGTGNSCPPPWEAKALEFILEVHRYPSDGDYAFVANSANRNKVPMEPFRLFQDSSYREERQRQLSKNDQKNCFFTPNGLYKPWPNDSLVKTANTLWVDLDCYRVGVTAENMNSFFDALDFFGEHNLPKPSRIVFSGQGLYLFWYLHGDSIQAIPKNKKLFMACQRALYLLLKEYGADPMANNPARLLRLPGSINGKNNSLVRLGWGSLEEYTLEEMAAYLGVAKPLKKQTRRIKEKPAKKNKTGKRPVKSVRNLNKSRIEDLNTLNRVRGGFKMGHRNSATLFMATHLYASGLSEEAIESELFTFNSAFDPPQKPSELTKVLKSVLRHKKPLSPKSTTIIDQLSITERELPWLKTIINIDEKKKRRKVYLQTSPLAELVFKIYHANPKAKQREIAKMAGTSRTTVCRILGAQNLKGNPRGRPKIGTEKMCAVETPLSPAGGFSGSVQRPLSDI